MLSSQINKIQAITPDTLIVGVDYDKWGWQISFIHMRVSMKRIGI